MKITFDNLSSFPISLRESELLRALLNDLNEINSKLDKEIYIDWNNEHTEYSPERVDPCPDYYGTYTIRYDKDSTIGSEMDIETLDNSLFLLYDFTVNFMKKLLNTAVKVTLKGGQSSIYESIEQASEMTGLSIQTLKIRANKNTVPKDGIQVEWVDPHTKRSYQASKSKRKGNAYELKIIHELTDLGFEGLKSSRSESRNLDNAKIDIADTLGVLDFYGQCKRTKNTPNIETISEECPYKDKPLIIFWSKESDKQQNNEYVLMPKSYFYKIIKK